MNEIQHIRQVYQMLGDKESKEIYINRLNYLITEEYGYLEHMIKQSVPELIDEQHQKTLEFVAALPKDKSIVLYGAGSDGIEKLHYFECDSRFIGFCDKDKEKQKNGVHGYRVYDPEELIQKDNVSIVISTRRNAKEIERFLLDNGVCKERIYKLSAYMITIDPGQYFSPDFIKFEDEEIFIDAGCLNMRTSLSMKKYCSGLRKIYAFEPDPVNYQTCVKNKDLFDDEIVEVIPCATWSGQTQLYFDALSNGASRIVSGGKVCIEAVSIDEVVEENERITFIKMDVEGAELESLKGAAETIKRCKPKLAICIYHKPEDMTEIPLYIKSLVPEYKLYIRHHSNAIAETVLYAVL